MSKHEAKPLAPFKPLPWQIPPLLDKNKIMLLSGSAGGGKSRLAAEKVFAFASHYPGATCVVSRKKRDDMDRSTVPLIKEVVADVENNPSCYFKAREDRLIVRHTDGPDSEIIFTGMHNESQREGTKSIGKSGAVDMWWMEEATEYDEEDFNVILRAMRGNAADWQQIILTTNPHGRLHWINRRLIIGEEAAFYPSHANMNVYNPPDYENTLASMTGIQKKRLAEGLWVDGEGMVIDTWLDDHSGKSGIVSKGNVTTMAEYIPGYGRVVWYMDDGYAGQRDDKTQFFTERSNPRVFLLVQERRDGIVAVFAEFLEVEVLAGVHIDRVLRESKRNGWPAPDYVVYDGAAPALGGELKRAKLKAKPVRCKIEDGVDELRGWVGPDKNGVRKVIVHPRCQFVRWEMGSYVYDDKGVPMDAFNHTIDALRYGVWYRSHGPSQNVKVMAPGMDGQKRQEIDERVADIMAKVREKYENALIG